MTTNYSLSIDVPDVGAVAGSVDTTTGESAASGTVSGTSTPLGSEFGSAAPSTKLTELISRCFEPEELDSNNMWACDACEKKVQGLKSQQIETYPQQLMIQLKRFRFDPVSCFDKPLSD